MTSKTSPTPRRQPSIFRREEGQSIVFVAIALVVMIGFLGLVIDVGRVYIAQRQLQTATDAAALAAATKLPDIATAETQACSYGANDGTAASPDPCGTTSGFNVYGTLKGVTTSFTPLCLSSIDVDCSTSASCPLVAGCNAIRVKETVTVSPWVLGILHVGDVTVSATSTASTAGGSSTPLDVEMINDTTQSMQTSDTCGGTPTDVPSSASLTQEDCAKAGIRALLTNLYPCLQSLTTCDVGSASNDNIPSQNQFDNVGMVVFPGLKSNTRTQTDAAGNVLNELNCTADLNPSGQTDVAYSSTARYQIVPFSSDYRVSDTATSDPLATLNVNSPLVRSVYWPGDSCPNGGYPFPGGPVTSISGGGSGTGNYSPANNVSNTVGGGAGTSADSATTTSGGIAQGNSTTTTNTTGVTQGGSNSSSSSSNTIGAGPGSASSGDHTTTTAAAATSIKPTVPTNLSTAAGTSDYVLVTVTGESASLVAGSQVCAPSSAWTQIDNKVVVGATGTTPVIQATFGGLASAVGLGTGTPKVWNPGFGFFTGSCPAPASLPGTPNLTITNATAIAVRYTNTSGYDQTAAVAPQSGGPTVNTTNSPAAGPVTTTYPAPTVASQSWTGTARYVSLGSACTNGSSTTLATCESAVSVAGVVTGINFTFNAAPAFSATPANNTIYTITLMKNGTAQAIACTITANAAGTAKSCSGTGNVSVTTADNLELRVVKTQGTNLTSTVVATTNATETNNVEYLSLTTNCASASATACDNTTFSQIGTFTSANLTFASNVPAGDAYTITLFKNGATTGLNCTIAAGSKTCTGSGITGSVAIASGDALELQASLTTVSTAFSATATTTSSELVGGNALTSPGISTTNPNEDVVRIYGTGDTKFGTGNGLDYTSGTNSTATGAIDTTQPSAGGTPGSAGGSTVSTLGANWVGETIALIPTFPSSIQITVPTGTNGYVGGANDLLMVTLAVQSLGSNVICTPTGWTPIPAKNGATTSTSWSSGTGVNQVTQASFYTMQTSPGTTFNFGTACSGANPTTAVGAAASYVAVNFMNVDSATPLDGVTDLATTGTGTALTAPAITTNTADDGIVGLFTTDANSITMPSGAVGRSGSFTSAGIDFTQGTTVKSYTPAAVTGGGGPWTSESVVLRAALSSSIAVTPPADSSTTPVLPGYNGNTGDVMIVSIAAEGAGIGSICVGSADRANWTTIATKTSGSGATTLTQASFWTTASTAATDTFTFYANASCAGANVSAAASAIAINYTGVDLPTLEGTTTIASTGSGNGTTLTAPQYTTTTTYDEIVSLFATNGSFNGTQPAVATAGDWTNSGGNGVLQAAAGNQSTAATATTTSAANWAATTVGLPPLLESTITVTPPTGFVPGGSNVMLVSISVEGLGTGSICAPDSTWAAVPVTGSTNTVKSADGTLTQETFWTSTSSATTDDFSFNSSAGCGGVALKLAASAVTAVYTGIDPLAPIDGTFAAAANPAATALTAPAKTTTVAGDKVVAVYSTAAQILNGTTVTSSGGVTTSGLNDSTDNATGSYTPPGTVTSTPSTASWTAETIALRPLGTDGITIARPANPTTNDFLLVAVTVKGLASGSSICAPADTTWTQEGTTIVQGASPTLTQALFYSARSSGTAESYTFTFRTGGCSTSGTPTSGQATAIAVRYTGVNPITPIDNDGVNDVYSFKQGSNATISQSSVTAVHTGGVLVSFYGTGATSITSSNPVYQKATGAGSATGYWDKSASAGTPTTATSATAGSSTNFIGQTVVLEASYSNCGSTCDYGAEDPGGAGTDYASAIDAAESGTGTGLDWEATQPGRSNAQKVMILLSDGDATTTTVHSQPCLDAIQEAEKAEASAATNSVDGNTLIYVIAYGASYDKNSSCTADHGTGPTGAFAPISAQCTLNLLVDNHVTDPTKWASDAAAESSTSGVVGCRNAQAPNDPTHRFFVEQPGQSLENVFTQIAKAATNPRLVSNDAS